MDSNHLTEDEEMLSRLCAEFPDVARRQVLKFCIGYKWKEPKVHAMVADHQRWLKQLQAPSEEELQWFIDRKFYTMVGEDQRGHQTGVLWVERWDPAVRDVDTTMRVIVRVLSDMAARSADEKVNWIFDFSRFQTCNRDVPLLRLILPLLDHHFPETMGTFVVAHPGVLVMALWNLLKYLLHEETRQRIRFLAAGDDTTRQLLEIFHKRQIPESLGGDLRRPDED